MRYSSTIWIYAASALFALAPVKAWFFFWDDTAFQCNVQSLTWQGGEPPFSAWIVPINGQPFIYDIPDNAFSNGSGRYDILMQMNAGTSYIVAMSDVTGLGSGGSSQIHRVSVSNQTDCLYTANQNASATDFRFTVSGVAEQCKRGFELGWSGSRQDGPYNFTVVPLDQSFKPFDVALKEDATSMSDWTLNITSGSRFTIMMNDATGYGTGGVGGIYEVNNDTSNQDNDRSCIKQEIFPTGAWPVGLATNTLPAATLAVTQPAGSGKGLSGGAIAGIVIGVIALLLIILLALFFLRRRKKQRVQREQKIESNEVDLAEGIEEHRDSVSMIEPYHRLDPFVGGQEGTVDLGDNATITSAGFAGMGAGLADMTSRETFEEDRPGVAGPLPSKSQTRLPESPSTSSRPTIPGPALKNDLLAHPSSPRSPTTSGQPGPMRIINHDNPATLPAVPPGTRLSGDISRRGRDSGPTYRRHEDAGRVPVNRPQEEDVVDLPPLYTDVPRDGDVELGNGGPTAEAESPVDRRG